MAPDGADPGVLDRGPPEASTSPAKRWCQNAAPRSRGTNLCRRNSLERFSMFAISLPPCRHNKLLAPAEAVADCVPRAVDRDAPPRAYRQLQRLLRHRLAGADYDPQRRHRQGPVLRRVCAARGEAHPGAHRCQCRLLRVPELYLAVRREVLEIGMTPNRTLDLRSWRQRSRDSPQSSCVLISHPRCSATEVWSSGAGPDNPSHAAPDRAPPQRTRFLGLELSVTKERRGGLPEPGRHLLIVRRGQSAGEVPPVTNVLQV